MPVKKYIWSNFRILTSNVRWIVKPFATLKAGQPQPGTHTEGPDGAHHTEGPDGAHRTG